MQGVLNTIQKACKFETSPKFISNLHGGDINKVYLIQAESKFWVVKQNNASNFPFMLEKEAKALQYFQQIEGLRYPKPKTHFTKDNQQFLVMEYIEEGENNTEGQCHLGARLAQQHQHSEDSFGWEEDNYIGSLVQVNTPKDRWIDFFIENRLNNQIKIAFDQGLLNSHDTRQFEKMYQRLDEIIPQEKPALLHGDLWSGNYFITVDKEAIAYDPAIYFGHREMDIAMTKLFGGFSNSFYASYQDNFPLEKEWELRIPIFQLYPNLVHLNLFGGSYLQSIQSVIQQY